MKFAIPQLNTGTIVKYSVLLFFLSEVMAGPIRYYSSLHGVPWVIYLPKLELIVVMLILFLARRLTAKEFYITLALMIIYTLIGCAALPTSAQALFGFWTMVPLLFALAAGNYVFRDMAAYQSGFRLLYAICLSGIILNYFRNVPWSGSSFALAGQHIQSSRAWTDASFIRIGGFGRASFAAAAQMLILCIFITRGLRSHLLSILIWLITGAAIIVTTSKGVVLAYSVILIFSFLRAALRHAGGTGCVTLQVLQNAATAAVCTVMVVLPLLTISQNFHFMGNSTFDKLLFTSFQDRLSWTWPHAFALLKGGYEFLLGSGLGGAGTGQMLYDPDNYSAADNLFVFLAVQYGFVIAVLVTAYFLIKFFRYSRSSYAGETYAVYLSLAMFLLVYGCLTNEIEDGFMASAFGFCLVFQPLRRLA